MAGKGQFVCRGDPSHVEFYEVPHGESVESFASKTPCKICGAKIAFHVPRN